MFINHGVMSPVFVYCFTACSDREQTDATAIGSRKLQHTCGCQYSLSRSRLGSSDVTALTVLSWQLVRGAFHALQRSGERPRGRLCCGCIVLLAAVSGEVTVVFLAVGRS